MAQYLFFKKKVFPNNGEVVPSPVSIQVQTAQTTKVLQSISWSSPDLSCVQGDPVNVRPPMWSGRTGSPICS